MQPELFRGKLELVREQDFIYCIWAAFTLLDWGIKKKKKKGTEQLLITW